MNTFCYLELDCCRSSGAVDHFVDHFVEFAFTCGTTVVVCAKIYLMTTAKVGNKLSTNPGRASSFLLLSRISTHVPMQQIYLLDLPIRFAY